MELQLSWSALLRLAVAVLAVLALARLVPEIFLIVVSILVALTLQPLVVSLSRRLSRGAAVLLLAFAAFALLSAAALFVAPTLAEQVTGLVDHLPALGARMQTELHGHGLLSRVVAQLLAVPTSPEVKSWLARPLSWGAVALEAAVSAVLAFVFVFYLLLDGKLLYAWLLAYVPRRHRKRMGAMLPEVQEVVATYVRTQVVLSTLFGLYVFVVLKALAVPAALPLALLAALCDAIPVLGILVSTSVASLLALSVSAEAALELVALYAGYHVIEFYVLVPRLYGKRLRMSPLAVLLALVVGGALGGIPGAVLILPVVAAYPVVERHWLSGYLSDEVVDDHQALEGAERSAEKHDVADQVLRGEKT